MKAIDTFTLIRGENKNTAQEIFQLLSGKAYRDVQIILTAVSDHVDFCARVNSSDNADCTPLPSSADKV